MLDMTRVKLLRVELRVVFQGFFAAAIPLLVHLAHAHLDGLHVPADQLGQLRVGHTDDLVNREPAYGRGIAHCGTDL